MSDDLLRDLVEGERAALVPGKGAREATWAAVTRSVGEGAAPIVDPSAVVGPAGGASWLKIVVALVLGGGMVIGIASAIDDEPPARAPASEPTRVRAPPVVEAAPVAAAPMIEPVIEPAMVPPVEPIAEVIASEPLTTNKRDPKPRTHAAPVADAEEPETPSDASALAEEARLLAAARGALRRDAHADALARLAEHARRFPSGQLTEDRLALTARVHCDRGELEQGRRAAAELRRAFPRSSQLHRIDRDCD